MDIKSFHHVCIQTDRYEESLRFYRDILGFELIKQTPDFRGRAFNAWLKGNGLTIELQTGKTGREMKDWTEDNEGPVHLAFVVEDVPKEYSRLKDAGFNSFKIDKSGNEIYEVNGIKLFKMHAPEGTQIEVRDSADID